MRDTTIRTATIQDAAAILDVYAPYVRDTAITFEYEVPDVHEFQARITNTLRKYPYLVAERYGSIVGYAYAGTFKDRAAYDHSCELSIYVRPTVQGRGLGRELYETLTKQLRAMGIENLYACVSYPEVEDEYLTLDSVRFHEHLGFEICGRFHKCGRKFGRWYDMVWMEKFIGPHAE